jgi:uncharacterized protein YwgA
MGESIFKRPILIAYLVNYMQNKYPDKQIGKTMIQKMLYLMSLRGTIDIDYSMYYYGPYSQEVSNELDIAESIGVIEIKWIDDKGYFIKAIPDALREFESILIADEKDQISLIAEKFGIFNASELSIIATGFYLMNNFGIKEDRLVDAIHDLKQNHTTQYIKSALRRAEVI